MTNPKSLNEFVKSNNLRRHIANISGHGNMNTNPCYALVNFVDIAHGKNVMTICADSQSEVDEIVKSAEVETAFSAHDDRAKQISVRYRVKGTPFYYADSPEEAEEHRREREKIHGLQAEIDFEQMVKNGEFQY